MPEKQDLFADRNVLAQPRQSPLTPRMPEIPRVGSAGGRGVHKSLEDGCGRGAQLTARLDDGLSRIKGGPVQSEFKEYNYAEVHTSSWAQQTVVKFERDATNHWTKWGCGGKQLAQELWHLADELQNMCAKDGGQWFPDSRMQRLHEQLLFIVHGLSQQPPKVAQLGNMDMTNAQLPALTPRTPQSVTKVENARLRRDLLDAKTKNDAMENTFAAYVRTRDNTKARDAWLVKYGLIGRTLVYEITTAKTAFTAWSKHVQVGVRGQAVKRVAQRYIDITQDEHNIARASRCLGLWASFHRVSHSRSMVSATIGEWLQRQSAADLRHHFCNCFGAWRREARMEVMQRTNEQMTSKMNAMKEAFRREKEALLKKFGDAALAQLRKSIGGDQKNALTKAFQSLLDHATEEKAARKAKADAEEAARLLLERQFAAGERIFGRGKVKLFTDCFAGWRKEVEDQKLAAKLAEDGMSEALKRMFGMADALRRASFLAWAQYLKDDRLSRQLREMEVMKEIMARARQRAIDMLSRNANGNPPEVLYAMCLEAWKEEVYHAHLREKSKHIAMSTSMRRIREKELALRCMSIGSWAQIAESERVMSKVKQIWEAELRQRFMGLAQNIVMNLHKRLALTHIFEAWVERTAHT